MDATGEDAVVAGQIHILEMVATGAPLAEILEECLRFCEARSPDMLCSILLLDPDGVRLRHGAGPSLPPEYMRAIDGSAIGPSAGSCGTAAYRGKPVYVEDIATDPLWRDYRALALPHGLRACWSTPIYDAHRKLLGTFAIYFREPGLPGEGHRELIGLVTHLASIAISRQFYEAALRTSESRLHRLIQSDIIGIIIAELGGRIREANDYFLRMLGIPREDLAADRVDWKLMTPPEWVSGDKAAIRELSLRGVSLPFEKELFDRSGRRVPVRVSAALLEGIGGDCICLVEDLTRQKRGEERLRQSEKLTAIGQLAGGVAHDFNNQLSVILGYAELLSSRLQDPELRRFSRAILAAARNSGELTRNLLAFSRQGHFEAVPIGIHDLIDEVISLVRHSIDRRIKVRRRFGAARTLVIGDPATLQNALLNLALNARDAMPEGGLLEFATDLADASELEPGLAPGGYLHLQVTDDGIGMAEEVKQRVFEPFFTTKAAGQGTGMGLASVFGTVNVHKGRITVDSEPGRGTTFHLYLPLAPEGLQADELAGDAPAYAPRLLVLLVEDDGRVREMVTDMLAGDGHEIISASGGREALQAFGDRWREIDLVLLDMNMPDMDGYDTFHALRKINPDVRVLLSSGFSPEGRVKSLLEDGVLGLLQKPYEKAQLVRMMAQAMDSGL